MGMIHSVVQPPARGTTRASSATAAAQRKMANYKFLLAMVALLAMVTFSDGRAADAAATLTRDDASADAAAPTFLEQLGVRLGVVACDPRLCPDPSPDCKTAHLIEECHRPNSYHCACGGCVSDPRLCD